MSKINIEAELTELITRFKRLKKALDEENSLSPAQRMAAKVAEDLVKGRGDFRNAMNKEKDVKAVVEKMQAQQLAKTLESRGILGTRPPPRQPTDQEMFGHLVAPENEVKKAEQNWGNAFNNFFAEATKPINSRFRSPQEEQAYWDSLSIADKGGNEGY